jgi:ATP-binding cassette subfamily B protein
MLSFPMIALGYVINMYQQGSASMARIMEVLNREPEIRDAGRTLPVASIEGKIEFRDVGVRYGDTRVLRHVSFTVEPGTTTAIVGTTGVGKTTLMNLVPRVLEADEGKVLIDGLDVRRLPWRPCAGRSGMFRKTPFCSPPRYVRMPCLESTRPQRRN